MCVIEIGAAYSANEHNAATESSKQCPRSLWRTEVFYCMGTSRDARASVEHGVAHWVDTK